MLKMEDHKAEYRRRPISVRLGEVQEHHDAMYWHAVMACSGLTPCLILKYDPGVFTPWCDILFYDWYLEDYVERQVNFRDLEGVNI